jgi:hypothetical protein
MMAVAVHAQASVEDCAMNRAMRLLLVVCLASGAAWAADDPMVGNWKLNPQKSKMTDEMKVTSLGGNRYAFDFGGNPVIAVADGTDQPGSYGITIAVSVDGPDKWTVVRKKDGKVLVTGVWTLSKDGNTLTDHFTSARPSGGTTSLDYVYERRGGGTGFVADWVSRNEQVNSEYVIEVQPFEGEGLSFVTPGGAGTKNVKFDGKDYANAGAVVEGLAASARRVNESAIEVTDKINGKMTDTQEITVSEDGKTLTVTTHVPGRSVSNVQVFDRQ